MPTHEELTARLPKGSTRGRTVRKMNSLSIAKLMAEMLREPDGLTYEEMEDITGLSQSVIRDYVFAMRQEGICHVKAWVEDGRGARTRKQWAIGMGKKDAPRPPIQCVKERAKNYRMRKKQAAILNLPLSQLLRAA